MNALIQKLTETFSPSGYEHDIRQVIRSEIESLADEIKVDALGNLIALKGKSGKNGKRIMLAGHMDEIGLIATHIDPNGFIRFSGIGGLYPHTLYSGRVRFVNGITGVIGGERIKDIQKTLSVSELFIDVGATSTNNCPIKTGDVAAFERPFYNMGKRLIAKAMDDRIGCAVMIEALRTLKNSPHEIYFVFTTQEEVGLRGATTSAYGIDPDIGISLDVTGTGDTPKARRMDVGLGKGPAIKIKDGRMLSDVRVVEWMIRTAEKTKIPFQREVLEGGTTDATAIQLTRSGVPAGCISIPCRYIHSPSEMVDIDDVNNATKLLVALLSNSISL
ncbi:MAG: M42 family metallopeptidase [Chloroflexota bacterium]